MKHIKLEKVPKWVLFIFCLLCMAGSTAALIFGKKKNGRKDF